MVKPGSKIVYFDRPGDCSPKKGDWRFDNLNGSHHQKSSSEVLITLMMTSAQVVETSVTTTDNSPSRNFTHPDDQTTLLHLISLGLHTLNLSTNITLYLVRLH